MPTDQITRLRKLLEEATPGPWTWEDDPPTVYAGRGVGHGWNLFGRLEVDTNGPANLDLLCAATNALSALLDVAERCRECYGDLPRSVQRLLDKLEAPWPRLLHTRQGRIQHVPLLQGLWSERPAELPDRNMAGRPIKRVCKQCHAELLLGDMRRLLGHEPGAAVHLVVTEGVESTWHYHLSHPKDGRETKALCGAQVMNTRIPISAWGCKGHWSERWCATCKAIAKEAGP